MPTSVYVPASRQNVAALTTRRGTDGKSLQPLRFGMDGTVISTSNGGVDMVMASRARESTAEAPGASLEQLLARNPRLVRSDINLLQDWLTKQPHLPAMRDEELVPFLVSCEFSLERAKQTIDRCWTMRTRAPELFAGRDPFDPDNELQLQAFRVALLPGRPACGRRLVVMGYAPADAFPPAAFDGASSLRLSTALMELLALEATAEEAGEAKGELVLLVDTAHVTLGHMARTPLPAVQRLMAFVQEAAPMRISEVHMLHLSAIGHRAFSLVRPLMSAKLQRMTNVHSGDMEDFYAEFPKEILPAELGGSCGTVAELHAQLVARLRDWRHWLLEQEARKVDEALRPPGAGGPGPGIYAHFFGANGTFRKLMLD